MVCKNSAIFSIAQSHNDYLECELTNWRGNDGQREEGTRCKVYSQLREVAELHEESHWPL